MNLGTLLTVLFLVGMPLAMMFMHRGGHGAGGGGCGMGHGGHTDHTTTNAPTADRPTATVINGEVIDPRPAPRTTGADHAHH